MPTLAHSEQKENRDPIAPGMTQPWINFDAPMNNEAAWLISAIPDASSAGPDVLAVENVRIVQERAGGDPRRTLEFEVRNCGFSRIEKYFVNVWHVYP